MKQAWVPYPAYTDRAAWDSLMGPNKQRLIAAGEKLLDYKWKPKERDVLSTSY